MAKNFYNLPPPWNPGYAIPQSVLDEGLARHTFTTAQLPRGTYDNVKTGTAGYAVPAYVKAEQTGRGTFTTAWLPRGYYGPKIPHYLDQQYTKVLPDGTPDNGVGQRYTAAHLGAWPEGIQGNAPVRYRNPDIWGTYGRNAATAVLTQIAKVGPEARGPALKQVLSAVDPTLHGRVQATAQQLVRQGMHPSKVLHPALAIEFTNGALAEAAKIGKNRQAPQPNSLLGLGCYGRQALGATPSLSLAATVSANPGAVTTAPNPPPGYTWAGDHWERLKVGQVAVPNPNGGATVQVTIHPTTGAPMPITVPPPETAEQVFTVGPFTMVNAATSHLAEKDMTPAQRLALANGIVWALQRFASSIRMPATLNTTTPILQQIIDANPTLGAQSAAAGQASSAPNLSVPGALRNILAGKYPLYRFTSPIDGSDAGLYFSPDPNADPAKQSFAWLVTAHPRAWQDLSILAIAWEGIKELAAAIVKVVAATLDVLSDLACNTLKKPGAAAGAAAAATAAGPAGIAAGVGVQIAAGMCGGGPAPMPTVAPPSYTTPLIIAGLAIVGIAIMKKHKKKGTPTP